MENDPYILGSQYYQKKKPKASIFKGCICVIHQPGGPYWKKTGTRGFGSALKTEGTVFPNTDEAKLVYNIFFSGNLKECLQKEPK